MTTDDLTERIGRILNDEGWTFEGVHEPGDYDGCEDCRRVVDPIAARIAEEVAAHDARVRRDAAAKAETRLAGWMEHWNATARTGAVDEVAAILEANARAERAEARIKVVEDVLDRPADGTEDMDSISAHYANGYEIALQDIRRALDGEQ